jgi:hypothetical protein
MSVRTVEGNSSFTVGQEVGNGIQTHQTELTPTQQLEQHQSNDLGRSEALPNTTEGEAGDFINVSGAISPSVQSTSINGSTGNFDPMRTFDLQMWNKSLITEAKLKAVVVLLISLATLAIISPIVLKVTPFEWRGSATVQLLVLFAALHIYGSYFHSEFSFGQRLKFFVFSF